MINSEELQKYRVPAMFFGGGLLAGLLMFLFWFVLQPRADETLAPPPAASASAAQAPLSGEAGVLNGVTGGLEAGQAGSVSAAPGDEEEASDEVALGEEEPQSAEDGEASTEAPAVISDEQAIADGLLPAADPAAAEKPELRTWYVEVARGPGVTEILEVNAESVDLALAVVRDFRGNPKVTRGPSLQPLD